MPRLHKMTKPIIAGLLLLLIGCVEAPLSLHGKVIDVRISWSEKPESAGVNGIAGAIGGLIVAGPLGAIVGGVTLAATTSDKPIKRVSGCVIVVDLGDDAIVHATTSINHRDEDCQNLRAGDSIELRRFGHPQRLVW